MKPVAILFSLTFGALIATMTAVAIGDTFKQVMVFAVVAAVSAGALTVALIKQDKSG